MADRSAIAAVDLGSNSFHCQIARVAGDQCYPLDSLREPVRLGAGLGKDKKLDEDSQERALACLARFGERLRGLDRQAVRAVGTNTLRVAKNAKPFLRRARAALGFPIEVVAGREEARLIYLGVSHSLPASREKRLVIDIGGGSTECIIGAGYKPLKLESLFMGCVSYSLRYFRDGRVSKSAFKEAELAARAELQPIIGRYIRGNWQQAVGSSGTIRALAEILELSGYTDGPITPGGLDRLRGQLIRAGNVSDIELPGLRADRRPVLPGGMAILCAALDELNIEALTPATGAMRQGVLYDMLGRFHHHDMRDSTVAQFMQRYHVDAQQAKRVGGFAAVLYEKLAGGVLDEDAPQLLGWAAKLHEIGIPVAYSGYHKHSAYIISNADMPGFSREEQERLAALVLNHRRSLKKSLETLPEEENRALVLALRLAVLLCRARRDARFPPLDVRLQGDRVRLSFDPDWLEANPLTATALRDEIAEWTRVGVELRMPGLDAIAPAPEHALAD
ncbi:MAG: exopolyphosphatase [Burkholderiales bacterium]|nr:exopolyphosphatase [Burkholderiales bacterium]